MSVKIATISLGCVKNRIDTEMMLGALSEKCEFSSTLEGADIALINTCSFVNDAKQESIDTILEAAEIKKNGKLKHIIVTGCLSERYKNELAALLPEVDFFSGVTAYKDICSIVERVVKGDKGEDYPDLEMPDAVMPRVMTTLKPTAYLKIAEGCDNRCSYCVIPDIRGNFKSRRMEDILTEIFTLVQNGYTEIILIAQDTTMYGIDIYGKLMLPELIAKCAVTPGLRWLRVLYSYPDHITDELLDTMLKYDTVVPYIDMPVQHFADDVLSDMNRRSSYQSIKELISRIRAKSEDFILRTTLITGFPGETPEDFEFCEKALKELKFDRVGVFAYSQEDGTKAAEMPFQIDEEEKLRRQSSLIETQMRISYEKNMSRIGSVCDVLIEGFDEDSGMYYGRSYAEAPDADGKIFVESPEDLLQGNFYKTELVYAYDVDLKGVLVD